MKHFNNRSAPAAAMLLVLTFGLGACSGEEPSVSASSSRIEKIQSNLEATAATDVDKASN